MSSIDFAKLHEEVKLGKLAHVDDPKTLKMARFFVPGIVVPRRYNTDTGRAPFPNNMFGNNAYGNCVIAGRANQTLRIERIEQKRTLKITDDDAINKYKQLTGCVSPGDDHDTGLVMLDAQKDWRNVGWTAAGKPYTIHSYGELESHNPEQLKQGMFCLSGIQFGFGLPVAWQGQQNWEYNGESGPDWEFGSWGGHCVYGHGYDDKGVIVRTWGYDCHVNWAAVDKYCDEAWVIVDNVDSWVKHSIDVPKLESELQSIGAVINP